MTLNSWIVRTKENLQLSHGGLSQKQTSGTDPPMKVLYQSRHLVWSLTHREFHAFYNEITFVRHDKWN